jgi:signal transduction histidine kinase
LTQELPIEEQLLFLQGIYPYEHTQSFVLNEVVFANGRAADIHIVPSKYKLCILLFDVTKTMKFHQELQQQRNELKLLYEEAMRSMQRLKQAYNEIESQKELAETANQAKSDFLRCVTHDLKSPLTGILGFAQLLEMIESPLPEAAADYVQEIKKLGYYLLKLVNDLLDIAKTESSSIKINLELLTTSTLVEECINTLKPLANKNAVTFINRTAKNLPPVWIDPIRFRQILINFLSNAIKYNRSDGSIIISSYLTAANTVRINIKDTGNGISSDDLHKVFQPFERGSAEGSDIEGTGIGLGVCKQLAELMQSSVGVYSELGAGSFFWLEIPLAQQQLTELNPSYLPQNILYIADNKVHVYLMHCVLEQRIGSSFFYAKDISAVTEILSTHRISAILLDMDIFSHNSLDIFHELQVNEKTRHIPVIGLFNAEADIAEIKSALIAGFYDYMNRPLDFYLAMELFDRLAALY